MVKPEPVPEFIREAFRTGTAQPNRHGQGRWRERGIRAEHVAEAVGEDWPEIIRDYPDDTPHPVCLIRGVYQRTVIHVVCTTVEPVSIITSYHPDPEQWYPSFRKRRRRR
jgi:hypothetical protein